MPKAHRRLKKIIQDAKEVYTCQWRSYAEARKRVLPHHFDKNNEVKEKEKTEREKKKLSLFYYYFAFRKKCQIFPSAMTYYTLFTLVMKLM